MYINNVFKHNIYEHTIFVNTFCPKMANMSADMEKFLRQDREQPGFVVSGSDKGKAWDGRKKGSPAHLAGDPLAPLIYTTLSSIISSCRFCHNPYKNALHPRIEEPAVVHLLHLAVCGKGTAEFQKFVIGLRVR